MRFTVAKTITLNKTECDVLTRFEEIIDEMDLNATELEQLLFDICRNKGYSDEANVSINYEH